MTTPHPLVVEWRKYPDGASPACPEQCDCEWVCEKSKQPPPAPVAKGEGEIGEDFIPPGICPTSVKTGKCPGWSCHEPKMRDEHWREWARSALRAKDEQRREAAEKRCRHGWRGSVPERGERIVTPCPTCGLQTLFIGTGGHLTCANVPRGDGGGGCPEPSPSEAWSKMTVRAEQAETWQQWIKKNAAALLAPEEGKGDAILTLHTNGREYHLFQSKVVGFGPARNPSGIATPVRTFIDLSEGGDEHGQVFVDETPEQVKSALSAREDGVGVDSPYTVTDNSGSMTGRGWRVSGPSGFEVFPDHQHALAVRVAEWMNTAHNAARRPV